MLAEIEKKLNRFKNRHVLIVGDVILDRYIIGNVGRISPEAPVPVVTTKSKRTVLGGAANVANNIVSLGGTATIIGLIGDDEDGTLVENMLSEQGITPFLYRILPYSITKTRVIGERQQIARIDNEPSSFPFTEQDKKLILKQVGSILNDVSCVVISDYGKGLLTQEFTQGLISLAVDHQVPTVVDPKGTEWNKYRKATVITPNLKELGEAFGSKLDNTDDKVEQASEQIIKDIDVTAILTTRSEMGMSYVSNKEIHHAPTDNQEVFDVSGAGDTVVSTIALSEKLNYSVPEQLYLANLTAGIVVGKRGTATVSIAELINAIHERRNIFGRGLVSLEILLNRLGEERKKGKRIVFTNGCFDILHRGHVTYLEEAKGLGDVLIVGLNSDASVTKLKGASRPINNEEDRAFMLSKLGGVDFVTIFSEDTPEKLIEQIRPDVLVKGGDYKIEEVVGREYAGEVQLINFVDGYSTSLIIEKSKNDL